MRCFAGDWDYLTLDHAGSHLFCQPCFVSRGTRVDVIDSHPGKVAGTLSNASGVHGIASAEQPHPRPVLTPDSFTLLVVGSP